MLTLLLQARPAQLGDDDVHRRSLCVSPIVRYQAPILLYNHTYFKCSADAMPSGKQRRSSRSADHSAVIPSFVGRDWLGYELQLSLAWLTNSDKPDRPQPVHVLPLSARHR